MPEITMSDVTELTDPKIRKVAMRVVHTLHLAAEKAVASYAEPTKYPIPPDPNSLEQIFSLRLKELPPAKKQAAVAKTMSLVNSSVAVRTGIYSDLSKTNLRLATPVEDQVKALAFPEGLKFPSIHIDTFTIAPTIHSTLSTAVYAYPIIMAATPQPINKLELRIHKVECLDETGWSGPGEWGEDEIYLGGTTVDETGDTEKVPQFKVGDFDDGDVKTYSPPKRFTSFNLLEGTAWPKSYFVTLVLAEVDMGGLADFLNKLLEKVREKVIAALTAAIGAAIGASGGPVGAIIGAVVGYVVGKIFEWLSAWWSDDIFKPYTVSVKIPSLNARWAGNKTDSPESWVKWRGHDGEYRLWYDWRLYA